MKKQNPNLESFTKLAEYYSNAVKQNEEEIKHLEGQMAILWEYNVNNDMPLSSNPGKKMKPLLEPKSSEKTTQATESPKQESEAKVVAKKADSKAASNDKDERPRPVENLRKKVL